MPGRVERRRPSWPTHQSVTSRKPTPRVWAIHEGAPSARFPDARVTQQPEVDEVVFPPGIGANYRDCWLARGRPHRRPMDRYPAVGSHTSSTGSTGMGRTKTVEAVKAAVHLDDGGAVGIPNRPQDGARRGSRHGRRTAEWSVQPFNPPAFVPTARVSSRPAAHAKPQMTKATKHASRTVAPTTMTHSRGLILWPATRTKPCHPASTAHRGSQ